MKKWLFFGIGFCVSLVTGFAVTPAPITPAQSQLGINFPAVADYSTDYAFVDVFRMSRKWISQRKGEDWGAGPDLARDTNGWITSLETNCWAETLMLTASRGHAPEGDYVCLYDGEGTIEFRSNSKIVERAPGRIVVHLDPKHTEPDGGIFLLLRETNPTNYVRNIRFLMPGFEATYQTEPFYPPFLARWSGFNTFRFMDWMFTNDAKKQPHEWADRPTTNYCNYTEHGVPVEVMVELCNRLKSNPWFSMPHLASDDYIRQFATLVRRTLDPKLKAYVEYSNEVWNSGFDQHKHAERKGKELKLGLRERPWEGAALFYGLRSQQVFKLWEEAFGGRTTQFVRVIAWQACAGKAWTDDLVLGKHQTGHNADVLAIAPYMTMLIHSASQPDDDTVAKWTVEQVLNHVEKIALPECLSWVRSSKKIADKYHLHLVCYESGQHLLGTGDSQNNAALTKLFIAANRHPRMGALYTKYLDALHAAGCDLVCLWNSTGIWTKYGSWGLAEYLDEAEAAQPKLKAVCDWNRQHFLTTANDLTHH